MSVRCKVRECPVDGAWYSWSSWGSCSKSCGAGYSIRRRASRAPRYGGKSCIGPSTEIKKCIGTMCPVNGGWSSIKWGSCSRPCIIGWIKGIRYGTRTCTNPAPRYGGKNCIGSSKVHQYCNLKYCPINGGWSPYGSWSTCTKPCGSGIQSAYRTCTNPKPANGGLPCAGSGVKTQACNTQPCPVPCRWLNWEDWGTCSKTCGTGTQSRRRGYISAKYGGPSCSGPSVETRYCNIHYCPIDGKWSPFGDWSSCSKPCNTGSQTRTRTCTPPKYGGKNCQELSYENRACNTYPCPVDGKYGSWTVWGQCDKPCGGGTQIRSRKCDSPAPLHGGKDCVGPKVEIQACNTDPCPIDGGWGPWDDWSECDAKCDGGQQFRERKCNSPAPHYGGKPCQGQQKESNDCNTHHCPIDGKWGEWSDWGACSQVCGEGEMTRSRKCNEPPPEYGGEQCVGNAKQTQKCNLHPCPVDGGWSDWDPWTECSKKCDGGVQTRSRKCDNPIPINGGEECKGVAQELRPCNTDPCPIDGAWGVWVDDESPCSAICGGGFRKQKRDCDSPAPEHGGKDCEGPSVREVACNTHECPIDGGWGKNQPSICSVSCGKGQRTLTRKCDNPEPQFGGKDCEGEKTTTDDCPDNEPCPIDGGWGDWDEWGACSTTCGDDGVQYRKRSCDSPAPSFLGKTCDGADEEMRKCVDNPPCPVNGGWGDWGDWENCSVPCGTDGTRTRRRACDNPAPQNGGDDCVGEAEETGSCDSAITPEICPVDGGWGNWTEYDQCTTTCGPGNKTRTRTCDNPAPQGAGKDCEGLDSETVDCANDACEACPSDETPGGHTAECLQFLFLSVGCTRHGTEYPEDPETANGGYWNKLTVGECRDDMAALAMKARDGNLEAAEMCFGNKNLVDACGLPNKAGPHDPRCLQFLWAQVGCLETGAHYPVDDTVNKYWNSLAVSEVRVDMQNYYKKINSHLRFLVLCQGPKDGLEQIEKVCGDLDKQGDHSVECLQFLWQEVVGCSENGEHFPATTTVNPYWQKITVNDVYKDMKVYKDRSQGGKFRKLCLGE